MVSKTHILIVGAGSVGKRHAKNFYDLGCNISAVDPQPSRLQEIEQIIQLVNRFDSFDESCLLLGDFDGVIICSPPKYHLKQAQLALEKNLPVLLEKPPTKDLLEYKNLHRSMESAKAQLLIGYCYRWWPPMLEIKKLIDSNRVGKIYFTKMAMSAHLQDWHPWERYQEFFMSSQDLGGGALLDESHFLDLLIWFFGLPEKATGHIAKVSSLEIDTDDHVDMTFSYPDGMRASIHLDLYGRPHEKSIQIYGENGSIRWTVDPNVVEVFDSVMDENETELFDCSRNEMFIEEAKTFLAVVAGEPNRWCTGEDGLKVMTVIDAICRSNSLEKTVTLV